MNFFKKVMTFFSTIWNTILWRRPVKKSKHAPKSASEEQQADVESNPEGEKLFVDIPLNSTEASETTEHDVLITDESRTAACAPVVTHETEPQAVIDSELKKYSSSVQLIGFGEETSRSLSFFSEPIRDEGSELPAAVSILDDEHCELKANAIPGQVVATEVKSVQLLVVDEASQSSIESICNENEPDIVTIPENGNLARNIENEVKNPNSDSPESKMPGADIILVDQRDDFDRLVSEELPTPPTEPILEDTTIDIKDTELTAPVLEDESAPSCVLSSSVCVNTVNNGAPLGIQPSIENITCSSTDRNSIPPLNKINPDLTHFAIENEMHLFDHGADDVLHSEEEGSISETSQAFRNDHPPDQSKINPDWNYLAIGDETHQSDPATDKTAAVETSNAIQNDQPAETDSSLIAVLKTAEAESNIVDVERSLATSSTQGMPFCFSASSTLASLDAEDNDTDRFSIYSTNYMVKSDSLVNFLPEGGSLINVTDVAVSPKKRPLHDEEKEIQHDFSTSVLKEGSLEEIMCTPRGVLKLSGDHNIDSTDECTGHGFGVFEDSILMHDAEAPVDDHVKFLSEEPLLLPSHLEGSVLKETVETQKMTDDPPFSDDGPGKVLDNSKCRRPNLLRTSLILQEPAESRRKLGNDSKPCSPDFSREVDDEDRRSPCKLSQFTTFHSENSAPPASAKLAINENLLPDMENAKYGEITTNSGTLNIAADKDTSVPNQDDEQGPQGRFMTEFQQSDFFKSLDWEVTLPSMGVEETNSVHGPGHMFASHINSGYPSSETMNDNHPFIDCSSCLLRIPEEIRNDTGFNPCVGAAPFRRSSYANNISFQSGRFDDRNDAYEKRHTKLNALAPSYVGVPLINSCIPEEYHDNRIGKLPSAGYNPRAVPENLGTFWETHPGSGHHGDQQQATVGFPVTYPNDFYEGENPGVMATAVYESEPANIGVNTEVYTYPYGEVEFPILSIPLCPPQVPPAFIPRPTMVIPLNVTENQVPSHTGAATQSERYSNPEFGRYPTPGYLQRDDEEPQEIGQVAEVRCLTPVENMSCTGTNDENEDDFDINPISDPYFLAGNNSLHTVKSKADSYSGSLFCESLRSLISHNTDNENVFPSFSCSSVQGYCPSIVIQSRGTTLSNDSLPSIIVEENSYCKSVDEDYLATEKFMNDVNTALNESVLDQIQGRNDMQSNLLGRGDGSMPLNQEQSGQEDQPENDVMLRNSLGENISINNSKLTLLDGILGTNNGESPSPELPKENRLEENSSSNSAHTHCQEVLDLLIDSALEAATERSSLELGSEVQETNTDGRENVDDTMLCQDRDVVVQSMMFIEGMPDELRSMWDKRSRPKQDSLEKDEKIPCMYNVDDAAVSEVVDEKISRESGDVLDDHHDSAPTEGNPDIRGRRNRKRIKKPTKNDPEASANREAIGDGVQTLQDQPVLERNFVGKIVEDQPAPSEPQQMQSSLANSERSIDTVENPKDAIDDVVGPEGDEDDPGEQPGNSSNNRRRRNRRRRRRN